MRRSNVYVIAAIVLIASTAAMSAQQRRRVPAGTEVEFIVKAGTNVTTGEDGDILMVTGVPDVDVSIGDCSPTFGFLQIQPATLVDPGGGRPMRLDTVMVTNWSDLSWIVSTTAAPPGTRIENLEHIGRCAGTTFDKYKGVVK